MKLLKDLKQSLQVGFMEEFSRKRKGFGFGKILVREGTQMHLSLQFFQISHILWYSGDNSP